MFADLDHGGAGEADLSVTEVDARWVEERGPTWAKRTRQEFEAAVRMFVEAVGDKPARRVTRADARDFKDLLMKNIEQVNQLQQDAEMAIEDLAAGRRDDLVNVLNAKRKADEAFKLLLSVRNKMVDAFEEIKQMRV